MPVKVREGYAPRVAEPFVPGIYLNPQIPEGAFGGQIGRSLQNLGAAAEAAQKRNKAEQDKLQGFEMRKAFIEDTIQSQDDLIEQMNSAPPGAEGFSSQINTMWQERTAAALQRGREAGWSEEVLQDYELRLMGLRETVFGQAQTFQEKSFKSKVGADVKTVGEALAKFAANTPEEVDNALIELRDTIDAIPDLDTIFKEQLYEELAPSVYTAAALAVAANQPEETLNALRGHKPPPAFLETESVQQLSGVNRAYNDVVATAAKYLPKNYSFQVAEGSEGKVLNLVPIKNGKPDTSPEGTAIVATAVKAASEELGTPVKWAGEKGGEDRTTFTTSVEDMGPEPTAAGFAQAMKGAISAAESRGIAAPYQAVGPEVKKGMYKGDHGYGRYQVMGKNIPEWTKQALGQSYTKEEFLADSAIQDAVFEDQMIRLFNKYGNVRDAASVWFTGQPYAEAIRRGANDDYTSVQEYVATVEKAFGGTGNFILDKVPAADRAKLIQVAERVSGEQSDAIISDFELRLAAGEISNPREQLDTMYNSGIIKRPEDFKRLSGMIDSIEKEQEDMDLFASLFRGETRGNPSDPDMKAAMNAGGEQLLPLIDQGPPAAGQADELFPQLSAIMNNTHMLPQNVVDRLTYESKLGDPVRALWASRQLVGLLDQEAIQGNAAVLSSMLSADDLERLRAFQAADGAIPEEQLIEEFIRPKTASEITTMERRDEAVAAYIKENPFEDLVEDFDHLWGPDASDSIMEVPHQYGAFMDEYTAIFRRQMTRLNFNGDLAREATVKQMKDSWGFNELNGKFMKYPPTHPRFENVYPTHIDGTKDWMKEQLQSELTEKYAFRPDLDEVFLTSDSTTEREVTNGVAPSYMMAISRGDTGEIEVIWDQRYRWEYPAELEQEKILHEKQRVIDFEAEVNRNKLEEKQRRRTGRAGMQVPNTPASPDQMKFFAEKNAPEFLRDMLDLDKPPPAENIGVTQRRLMAEYPDLNSDDYQALTRIVTDTANAMRDQGFEPKSLKEILVLEPVQEFLKKRRSR